MLLVTHLAVGIVTGILAGSVSVCFWPNPFGPGLAMQYIRSTDAIRRGTDYILIGGGRFRGEADMHGRVA